MTLCVASQREFIAVSIYFFIGSVRKLLDTPSYIIKTLFRTTQDTNMAVVRTIMGLGLKLASHR
jgi:hypothetical protein